jgi:hypothetical protein
MEIKIIFLFEDRLIKIVSHQIKIVSLQIKPESINISDEIKNSDLLNNVEKEQYLKCLKAYIINDINKYVNEINNYIEYEILEIFINPIHSNKKYKIVTAVDHHFCKRLKNDEDSIVKVSNSMFYIRNVGC